MIGILKKLIEVTDRIALIGVPDEKRRLEYRRVKFAERDAVIEEQTPELSGETAPPARLEQVIEKTESIVKPKPIDLLTVAPLPDTELVVPVPTTTTPRITITPAAAAPPTPVTPPATAAGNKTAAVSTANKGAAKGMDLGNITNMFEEAQKEEASPVQRLTASMPDMTAAELLKDIKAVERLLRSYVNDPEI